MAEEQTKGTSKAKGSPKSCFVIGAIGADGSEIRSHADKVMKYLIQPAVKTAGYEEPIRADQMPKPGTVTEQIIEHVVYDDLVIADLSPWNPNVFYELAVRHSFGKPVVLMTEKDTMIPFDVSVERIIIYDLTDWDSPAKCQTQLVQQIKYIENHPNDVESPIVRTVEIHELLKSDMAGDRQQAALMSITATLKGMQSEISSLSARILPSIGSSFGSSTLTGFTTPSTDLLGSVYYPPVTTVDFKTCTQCGEFNKVSALMCSSCQALL